MPPTEDCTAPHTPASTRPAAQGGITETARVGMPRSGVARVPSGKRYFTVKHRPLRHSSQAATTMAPTLMALCRVLVSL